MAVLEIYTYGGGEVLRDVFNCIAIIFKHKEGPIQSLVGMFGLAGLAIAAFKAWKSGTLDYLFFSYLLPLVPILSLVVLPTTTVHIHDVFNREKPMTKVDHVPLLLGKFAEIVSSVGYKLSKSIDSVFHKVNDKGYSATGMVFGSDSALDYSRYRITDGVLKQNLSNFCKKCVVYDIAHGRYTIDDLKKAPDILELFSTKSSKASLVKYRARKGEHTGIDNQTFDSDENVLLPCRKAASLIKQKINSTQVEHYIKRDVYGNLPFTYQALTKKQAEQSDLVRQELMINAVTEEIGGFAKYRAKIHQQQTHLTNGQIVGSTLIAMRIILEALIYALFIIVIPAVALPNGISFFTSWAKMVVWIQLWPIFFSIISYISQSDLMTSSSQLLANEGGGLTLFTNAGLLETQQDVRSLAGYCLGIVHIISFAVVNGSLSSLSHLAGTLLSPGYQAAGIAASESTTGNYSFGNASMDQTSYANASRFQTNLAPSLVHGHMREDVGSSSTIHGSQETLFRQGKSELRHSFSSDELVSKGVQIAKQHAETDVETHSNALQESVATHGKQASDFVNHFSKSEAYSENVSEREATAVQRSASEVKAISEDFGRRFGMSQDDSLSYIASAGTGVNLGCVKLGGSVDKKYSGSKTEAFDEALRISNNENFQENLSRVEDFAKNRSYNGQSDTGSKLADSYSWSLDNMKSQQQSHQSALSKMNQISENATTLSQSSVAVRRNLDQDFKDWAVERLPGGFSEFKGLTSNENADKYESLASNFIAEKVASISRPSEPSNYSSPTKGFSDRNVGSIDQRESEINMHIHSRNKSSEKGVKDSKLNLKVNAGKLYSNNESQNKSSKKIFNDAQETNSFEKERLEKDFDDRNSPWKPWAPVNRMFSKTGHSKFRTKDPYPWTRGR